MYVASVIRERAREEYREGKRRRRVRYRKIGRQGMSLEMCRKQISETKFML